MTINTTNVTIYAVDSCYDTLKQPSSAPKTFQLKVTGAKKATYTVTGTTCIKVSSTGLIQADPGKVYYYSDGYASSAPP